MSYGTPVPALDAARRVVSLSAQYVDENQTTVFVAANAEFTVNDIYGAVPSSADDLFQHLLDHLADIPPFPGTDNAAVTVTASKTYPTSQEVTPTA